MTEGLTDSDKALARRLLDVMTTAMMALDESTVMGVLAGLVRHWIANVEHEDIAADLIRKAVADGMRDRLH